MKELHVSLLCRLKGEEKHEPCSGTADDGSEEWCDCWCHYRK